MKKKIGILNACSMLFFTTFPVGDWRSSQEHENTHFFGTLTTRQGNRYEVTDIRIGASKKTHQIPLYEKPKVETPLSPQPTQEKQKEQYIPLTVNPTTDLAITSIDLNEINGLHSPNPDIIWVYKKNRHRKIEYIEIVVTKKDEQQTRTSYLIERKTDIYCSRKLAAGLEEIKVPITALDTLLIEGYYFDQPMQKNNHSSHAAYQSPSHTQHASPGYNSSIK